MSIVGGIHWVSNEFHHDCHLTQFIPYFASPTAPRKYGMFVPASEKRHPVMVPTETNMSSHQAGRSEIYLSTDL